MPAFDNACRFFDACERALGWNECRSFVAPHAAFRAQCEPLKEITTVEAYCEWMRAFGAVTAPGAYYDLHASAYDERTRTAIFFATYHCKHTGQGGPVPPTNKEAHTHYVYVFKMSQDDKIAQMTKVWNASWALREMGWL